MFNVNKKDELFKNFKENNDERSFYELFKTITPDLANFINRIVMDKDLTKDILQDTWVSLLNHIDNINIQDGKLTAYIFQIAKYQSFKTLKKNRRDVKIENYEKYESNKALWDDENPEAIKEKSDLSLALRQSIDSLPKKYQDPIVLHYFGNYKYKDIANMLDKTENTIKTLIGRGRKRLESKLEKYL